MTGATGVTGATGATGTAGVTLIPAGGTAREPRFLFSLDGRHAGGVSVHSARGELFSYGIAVSPGMRRRGAASAALAQLFEAMRARGFARAVVSVEAGNEASLALHRKLGFEKTGERAGVIVLEKAI